MNLSRPLSCDSVISNLRLILCGMIRTRFRPLPLDAAFEEGKSSTYIRMMPWK